MWAQFVRSEYIPTAILGHMIGRLLSNYKLAAPCDYPSNQMACCGLLYLHQVTCSGIVNDFSYKTRDDIRSPLLMYQMMYLRWKKVVSCKSFWTILLINNHVIALLKSKNVSCCLQLICWVLYYLINHSFTHAVGYFTANHFGWVTLRSLLCHSQINLSSPQGLQLLSHSQYPTVSLAVET